MPKTSPNFVPSCRKHKSTGQAVVTLNGKDYYLGRYGTTAARNEYDRLIKEWLAGGRTLPRGGRETLNEIVLAYLRFAIGYYRGSDEVEKIKLAVRPLKELYGRADAAAFSPLKLKEVRQAMIDASLSRRTVNSRWLHQATLQVGGRKRAGSGDGSPGLDGG
jgi:hypothetical protein